MPLTLTYLSQPLPQAYSLVGPKDPCSFDRHIADAITIRAAAAKLA